MKKMPSLSVWGSLCMTRHWSELAQGLQRSHGYSLVGLGAVGIAKGKLSPGNVGIQLSSTMHFCT